MSSPVDIKHTLYSTADVCMPDSSAADKCGLYLLHVTKQNPPHSHTSAAHIAGAKCTLTCCQLLDCELQEHPSEAVYHNASKKFSFPLNPLEGLKLYHHTI